MRGEQHQDDDPRRRGEHEQEGDEPFGGVAARERVDLDARRAEHAQIEGTKRRRPGLAGFEGARRPRLDPREHAEADEVGDENDRPEPVRVR